MDKEFKTYLKHTALNSFIGFIIALLLFYIVSLFTGCTSSKPIDKQIIYVTDTTSIKKLHENIKTTEKIRRSNIELYAKNDSLQNLVDSLNTEVIYNKLKLERVRYYNDIARKGNNIKFLRGWINRVLND